MTLYEICCIMCEGRWDEEIGITKDSKGMPVLEN
jgi:hypothetical protein